MTDLLPAVDLDAIVKLADFEPIARDRMLGPAYDYVAGGSWDEITLRESVEAWQAYRFVPRVLSDLRSIDPSGTFLERASALPIAIAPMAAQAMAHPGAEAEMAAGAAAAGIPFCLSTSSSMSLEDVAHAAPDAERWFQLYVIGGFDYSRRLVERAEAAGYRAIVLTVDLPVLGRRERDVRSAFVLPPMSHMDAADAERQHRYGGLDDQRIAGLTWDSLAEIRSWSSLPLVLKGILSPADAKLAVEAGAAGIVVSTHGGRQLDRSISSAAALAGVVDAVAGRCEVWADGGIRRGLDIVTAIALGATGVLIGRPFYWALAAGGRAGVERAAEIVRGELALALPLMGVASIQALNRGFLA
ncbi:MAG TPA: alpha-hydroxy acid oxidase [Patescibacteria group bacterium]|jgi:4-hydroxymandelate oxidase|nr:alpha-hydroxy acid oxidase [Patescibacteria group bacterium]